MPFDWRQQLPSDAPGGAAVRIVRCARSEPDRATPVPHARGLAGVLREQGHPGDGVFTPGLRRGEIAGVNNCRPYVCSLP